MSKKDLMNDILKLQDLEETGGRVQGILISPTISPASMFGCVNPGNMSTLSVFACNN